MTYSDAVVAIAYELTMAGGLKGPLRATDSLASERSSGPTVPNEHRISGEIGRCFDELVVQVRPDFDGFLNAFPNCDSESLVVAARNGFVRYAVEGTGENDSPDLSPVEATIAAAILEHVKIDPPADIDSILPFVRMSSQQLSLIGTAVKNAQALANELVSEHQPLAQATARFFRHTGLDIRDLEQEGFIGLRKAAFSFDHQKNGDFTKFARRVIRNHLTDFVRRSTAPTQHSSRQLAEFSEAEANLMLAGNPRPLDEEVFERLGWSQTKRDNLRGALRLRRPEDIVVTGDSDQVPDCGDDPASVAGRKAELRLFCRALSQLSAEDQLIISLRYSNGLSFPEIGSHISLTGRQTRLRHDAVLGTLALTMNQGKTVA